MSDDPALTDLLKSSVTNHGQSLYDLSCESPVMVVCLRHGGCPFCRETLGKLAAARAKISEVGTRIVLVHMMNDASAAKLAGEYGVEDLSRISDPDRKLYAGLGLKRGTLGQVAGPRVWWRGFKATALSGFLPGVPAGDIYQLPGAFLIVDGQIVHRFEPATSAEQTDFAEFATCELPPT